MNQTKSKYQIAPPWRFALARIPIAHALEGEVACTHMLRANLTPPPPRAPNWLRYRKITLTWRERPPGAVSPQLELALELALTTAPRLCYACFAHCARAPRTDFLAVRALCALLFPRIVTMFLASHRDKRKRAPSSQAKDQTP